MALRTLQEDFQAAVLDDPAHFVAQVVNTATASAECRIDIYAQAYRLRLLEALAGDYTKLAILLGEAQFESLGHSYIAAHPSRHPSLRWLGRHMAAFLAATPPWSGQPLLSEMAAFEWAQGEVFDAPDATALGPAALAAIAPESWPQLRLQAHPSLRRLDLSCNVPAIWQALEDGDEPCERHCGAPTQSWLLWRQNLDIHWRSLSVDERWALDAWRNAASFSELCEGLCEWLEPERVPAHAAGLLKGWVNAGLVTALRSD